MVQNNSKGAKGLRTISKKLLAEYVEFVRNNPNSKALEIREYLSGKSDVDKYEYGYSSTLLSLAQIVLDASKNNMNACSQQVLYPIQVIFFGAPGTGKSFAVNSQVGGNDNPNAIRTTFHPDSDYSSFVGCYKPSQKDGSDEITYEFCPQAFTKAYVTAWQHPERHFYLVIEEINRGNCAQIFGDIFQLLDRNNKGESSYTISPDNDLQKHLSHEVADCEIADADIKSGAKMKLPSNLSIIATMNTSDQSLFPIDSAFKRRWDWKYIPINKTEEGHYIECGGEKFDWWNFLEKVNPRIEQTTGSEDKQLGFWFAKPDTGEDNLGISADKFVSKVVFYLWNDVFKDYASDANNVFKTEDRLLKFREFFDKDGNVDLTVLKKFLQALDIEHQASSSEGDKDTASEPNE